MCNARESEFKFGVKSRYLKKSALQIFHKPSMIWPAFSFYAVLEKVRNQIKARGAKTIRGLGRTFRNFDSFDGNHKIDAEEFYSGLCEIQIQVTRAEANALMALFDTDGDGNVNFDEFLVGIRVSTPSSLAASSSLWQCHSPA